MRDHWYLDDLEDWIRAGVSPIVLVTVGPLAPGKLHYLVVSGFDDDARELRVVDQDARETTLSYEAFFPRWAEARGWALVVCAPSFALPPGHLGLSALELGALGWLAEREGALEAARADYRAALEEDGGFGPARRNIANVERALAARYRP